MSKMSQREYSRHRGCSLRAVQKALATGRIQAQGGKIDSEAADFALKANTDPLASKRDYAKSDAGVSTAGPTAQRDSASKAYIASRAARGEIRRQREQMQLDLDRGELVRLDEWEERVTKLIVTSRSKLLSIPSQVKGRLPHLSRKDVLVIDHLVRDALEDLANHGASAALVSPATEGHD